MAVGTLFLPFLPLLAKQILLNNFISDIPAVGIAVDSVDWEWERKPRRWNIGFIRNFMITFGLMSTCFDLLTFAALLYLAGNVPETFRTGWFIESLVSELLVLFVMRTSRPFYQSRPGRFLLWTTPFIVAFSIALPYLPIGAVFGFAPLSAKVMAAVLGITLVYVVASEITKHKFYKWRNNIAL